MFLLPYNSLQTGYLTFQDSLQTSLIYKYLALIFTIEQKRREEMIKSSESVLALTSKTTAPRATHLTTFQFSLRKLYIVSKFPVLSEGSS